MTSPGGEEMDEYLEFLQCYLKCPVSNKKITGHAGEKYNTYSKQGRQALEAANDNEQMSDLTKTL